MDEIYVEVKSKQIWVNICYYTNLNNFKKLGNLFGSFIKDLKPFKWDDGDNFKMKVFPRDKLGHIQIDFVLKNDSIGYLNEIVYCEVSLTFELGQIEKLSKQILNFIDIRDYSVEIEAM